jgi:hypothetical protein
MDLTFYTLVFDDPGDCAVRLLGVAGPMNLASGAHHRLFELQQVLVEVAHDALLDGASCLPERFPVGHLFDGDGALVADSLGCLPEIAS